MLQSVFHVERDQSESPKPKLSIRIPAPRPDEEILQSPVATPSAPVPPPMMELKKWLRGQWVRAKI